MENFESTVPVRREELEELKKQAEEINRRIKELSAPKHLAPYVSEKPLSHPRNLKDDVPIFGYTNFPDHDAWNSFLNLAKTVHTKSPQFYMGTAFDLHSSSHQRPYIRSTGVTRPRYLEQMTMEQIKTSAEMLNEMIAIYNRYYVMLHSHVMYDPKDGSEIQIMEVCPPGTEVEENEI